MKRILIIDDDSIVQNMYEKILINHGFEVEVESDGLSGLKKALNTHPDLVLLDIRLPGMNGLEVLRKLREDNWGKKANVIILSNYDATDRVISGVSVTGGASGDSAPELPDASEFWSIVNNLPTYYLIKSNNRPKQVLERVVEILGRKGEN